jgi:hypothetical protein
MRKAGMTKQEITDYLNIDMRKIITDDIGQCLLIGKPEGGYFSIPKLVLSCVDYLGALYEGWNGERDSRTRRPIFTSSQKATHYIQNVLGQVFYEYRTRGALLWEIYRHGTVHLNQPKTLQYGAETIGWLIIKGGFEERTFIVQLPTTGGQKINKWIAHLVPDLYPNTTNEWFLPLSTTCLYEDLLKSLDVYIDMINKNPNLENNFRSAIDEMIKPDQTQITWH